MTPETTAADRHRAAFETAQAARAALSAAYGATQKAAAAVANATGHLTALAEAEAAGTPSTPSELADALASLATAEGQLRFRGMVVEAAQRTAKEAEAAVRAAETEALAEQHVNYHASTRAKVAELAQRARSRGL